MLFFPPSFFQDGLKAVESLKPSIETLSTDLHTVSNFPPKCVSKVCTTHLDLNVAPVWCHVCMPHCPECDRPGVPPWSVGNRVPTLSSVFVWEGRLQLLRNDHERHHLAAPQLYFLCFVMFFKDQTGPGRREKAVDTAPRYSEIGITGWTERGEGI